MVIPSGVRWTDHAQLDPWESRSHLHFETQQRLERSSSSFAPPSIMPLESRVDVLIIGAGPAGLMCATALAMAGVDVRIIDKRYGCHFPQSQC